MSKFTPEPWRVEGRYVLALKQKPVCECPQGGIRHAKVDTANANLIAAAPDLYAAASCAATILYLLSDEVKALGLKAGNVQEMLKAALAKADGGTK